MNRSIITIFSLICLTACQREKNETDASGTFEAKEVIISAEANGVIKQFDLEEGQEINEGQYLGFIDSLQLYLKKKQLLAQVKATNSQKPDIGKQMAVLEVQLKAIEKEQNRIAKLVKADAATPKQMDDINAQAEVVRNQLAAQKSSLSITTENVSQQTNPVLIQIEQLDDQLSRCRLINTVKGTVLTKYAEVNEMTAIGKPLYKIAELTEVTLRVYVTGNQFSSIKINQQVNVLVTDGSEKYREYPGKIYWISNKAEFTPKTIQTKEERANLVYAVKIKVKNDGYLKIGMYADVNLNRQ